MSSALEWIDGLSALMGGAVGAGVTKWFERKKDRQAVQIGESTETKLDAEAAKIIADTAVTLIAPLQAQVVDLQKQVEGLTARVEVLDKENILNLSRLKIAMDHIRNLHSWISQHIPHKQPPRVPAALELDIGRSE